MVSNHLNFAYMRSATPNEHSIEKQRLQIQEFIKKHPDLPRNFEEVIDNGYSGADFDRPGIKKILELVKEGRVGMIIVTDISRLGRNYIAVAELVEQLFPGHGVRLIIANSTDGESDEPQIKLSELRRK